MDWLSFAPGDEDEERREGGGGGEWNDWGQQQRSIYLYPRESRQPWKSWFSLHRKSATCYSQAKLSRVEPRLEALRVLLDRNFLRFLW